ncbi:recombinase family protein [Streptomyces sp. NBC_01549]|uniref:recombinase family protein n=1 Tax=Streptomyces sp. NBC_01549 TaxID=2975874 RepID=UPI00224DB19B|nr:recombinase family protein [Streptomyces sp. NBC_01549]MCX4592455.1 recombinase family protein [Streptomyces sp. NBC_01549]
MGRSPRALITVRLTVQTGSTTSPERQIEECKSFCELRGWEIVGVASDLSVSATSVPPWKRPELSRWLDDHAPEFDVIVFWRLDRFVRRVGDLHQMIEWAESHGGKGLVSATEPFDLTSPTGKATATMIATFAQMEAQAAAERVASSRAHLLTSTRWGGSSPPFGYRTYARDGARYLEVNPETADIVREAARRVIGGEPINAICRDLEERGVPSPADTYQRNKSGKDFIWYPRTLKGILTSPTLLGWKTRSENVPGKKYKKRVLVRDQDGHPVHVTERVLSQETFDRLQDALADSASPISRRSATPRTPLLNVIKCGGCGKNLQLHTTRKRRKDGTYRVTEKIRCLSRVGSPACPGYVFQPDEEIITPVMGMLVHAIGDAPVTRREYVQRAETKGESTHPSDIADEDHWQFVPLGTTFAERWENMGVTDIGEDLIHSGITIRCHPRECGGHVLEIPEDFQDRLAKFVA